MGFAPLPLNRKSTTGAARGACSICGDSSSALPSTYRRREAILVRRLSSADCDRSGQGGHVSSTLAALLKAVSEKNGFEIFLSTREAAARTSMRMPIRASPSGRRRSRLIKRTVWISHTEVHEWMLEKSARVGCLVC